MAAKQLDVHPTALAELKSALIWYRERNEPAALKFAAEVDRAVASVIETPNRWPREDDGTRKFTLRRFPFALIYREKTDTIQLLAIAHGHRRPGY